MEELERNEHLDALNRAFEKAFSHTASKETLTDLLECMGEELFCDRISIFELNMDNTCDNTFEWCRPGKTHVRELLQGLPMSTFQDWIKVLSDQEFISIRDLESVRIQEPELYSLLHSQEVNSVIAAKLAFHGQSIGFFILENPGDEIIREAATVMPGMRYILSSLVYSDHLLKKLERIGYLDHLTNAGNKMGMQEALRNLNPDRPLGIVYCEVLGWNRGDHRLSEAQEEQALIRTSEVLRDMFDSGMTFRIVPGEFMTLCPEISLQTLDIQTDHLRRLFEEHDLLVAVGTTYSANPGADHDALIREAHLAAHNEIRQLTRKKSEHGELMDAFHEDEIAKISLYRTDEFFRQAPKHFGEFYDESILTIVLDINYFRLYNDIFGRKAGSVLLERIADDMLRFARKYNGIVGYLGGDNFVIALPTRVQLEVDTVPIIEELFTELSCPDGFTPALGVALSHDKQETLVAMYDHALTALSDIKGSYVDHYRFYDADHYRRDRESKMLMLDAKRGLTDGEFFFYLQPQVDEKSGRIVGAEALSRWMCKGQMVSPAQFVPALEKSGYIYAMDSFIWESVCKWIRSLLDRGMPTVPISINVSRIDFYFDDIAQHFIDLIAKYNLEPRMLGIEITESAFTDNTDAIIEAVTRLHDAGFRVLMDDFGSGSSSLSMLHTINLDVLKTDVRFMSQDEANSKAYNIVGSVVTMAHMIGMIVVTEGVETEQQRNNLVAMGGNFAQGFYFYRPMPVSQFEELLMDPEKIDHAFAHGIHMGENHLKFRDLIGKGMVSDTLLDNIIGPAAIYRQDEDGVVLTQFNEQYKLLAQRDEEAEEFTDSVMQLNREKIGQLMHEADKRPFEGVVSTVTIIRNGFEEEIGIRLFLLYTSELQRLYFLMIQEEGE